MNLQTDKPNKPLKAMLDEANAEVLAQTKPTTNVPEIDPTDLKAVKAMVWSKLVQTAAVMPANDKCLPILREIMDRLDGKPRQQIDTTLTGTMQTTIQIVRFSDIQPKSISGIEDAKIIDNNDKTIG